MAKVIVSLPLDEMPNVDKPFLFSEIKKMNFFSTIYYYVVNSAFRKSVNVRNWYNDWILSNTLTLPVFAGTDIEKCQQTLAWVRRNVTYVGDQSQWGMAEKWSLPDETLKTHQGDCEDGAILVHEILRRSGVSQDQLYIVAGDVVGGGHCYVVFVSGEDLLEYTVDWCYWPDDSLIKPYPTNTNYFTGDEEWFRFNDTGSFIKK